jgi:hypothetical protein
MAGFLVLMKPPRSASDTLTIALKVLLPVCPLFVEEPPISPDGTLLSVMGEETTNLVNDWRSQARAPLEVYEELKALLCSTGELDWPFQSR